MNQIFNNEPNDSQSGGTLTHLMMELDADKMYFNYHKASLLQGVMMQQLSQDYAEELHLQGLKPYSQYIRIEDGKPVWHIKTYSKTATSHIIPVLIKEDFHDFTITHDGQVVEIKQKILHTAQVSQLFNEFYTKEADTYISIEFLTPSSFKKSGRYSFLPEISNIYYSLMQKFDAVLMEDKMFSAETYEQLIECSELSSYSLRSVYYSMEGIKIPAFIGRITMRIHGPQTMKRFARLLLRFGEYSGVGIKTAIGMGAIQVTEGREGAKYDKKRV